MKPRSTSSHRPRSSRKTVRWPESPEQTARPGANCLAVQTFEPAPGSAYPIETAARLAGVTRRTILIYCKRKFIHPLGEPSVGGYWFAADEIQTIRQIERLRVHCRDELEAVATILTLLSRIQQRDHG